MQCSNAIVVVAKDFFKNVEVVAPVMGCDAVVSSRGVGKPVPRGVEDTLAAKRMWESHEMLSCNELRVVDYIGGRRDLMGGNA